LFHAVRSSLARRSVVLPLALVLAASSASLAHAAPPPVPATSGVAWFDLMVRDTARAAAFYGAVLGVTAGAPQGRYTLLAAAGVPIGGLMEDGDASAPHAAGGVAVYFAVDDVSAAVQRATAHGAKLVFGPMPIPGAAGTMALLRDLDDNAFGLMQR
jgi:predicted enzyme related to lactoylglutathione lyase